MARQRIIKPGFFTDERLAACTPHARLLFAGLWGLADRRGRLRDQPPVIHGSVFPYEPGLDVDTLLGEIEQAGSIQRYEVDGRKYIFIINFEREQKPHPREADSVLPEPGKSAAQPRKETAQQCGIRSFVPSESVGSSSVSRPPASPPVAVPVTGPVAGVTTAWERPPSLPPLIPPEQRAEDATNATIRRLQLTLGSKLAALAEHPNSRRMVPSWCREVTSYKGRDGPVKGVPDYRTVSSIDRLEKSIEDAEWWLGELNKGRVIGDEVKSGTR